MKFVLSPIVLASILFKSEAAKNTVNNKNNKTANLRAAQHDSLTNDRRSLRLQTTETRQWEPRIVGGQNADIDEFPFFVEGAGCGASLIWYDIVLTAAHCKGYIANFRNQVLVGAEKRSTEDDNSEWVDVATNGEIRHPEYDGDVYKDFMIVKLDREVTNPNVKLVGLAGDSTPLNVGDPLTVIGFGATSEGGSGSYTLQKVEVDYASEQRCASVYGNEPAYVPDIMFCAGGTATGGTDSCQGDSGGPIFKDNTQVGVVSWGYGCAQPGVPGVYATISAEIEWIKQMVCDNAAYPPDWACDGGTSPVLAPGTPPVTNPNPPPATPTPPVPYPTSPSPPSQPTATFNIKVLVAHDDYPDETSWGLVDADGNVLLSQARNSVMDWSEVISRTVAVPPGQYTFVIDDALGDGICCTYGQGSYEISVAGRNIFTGGNFGYSSGELTFCVDGNGKGAAGECETGGNASSNSSDSVEYFLTVSYDFWSYETGANTKHVASGTVMKDLPAGSTTIPYDYRKVPVDLVPGEEYELTVTDTLGDGMPDRNGNDALIETYVAVDIYVNDEFHTELALIDGWDFTTLSSVTFTVPLELEATKTASEQPDRNKHNICADTDGSFIIEGVEQDCEWLGRFWPKTKPFCNEEDVALACPSTCGLC